MSTVLFLSAGRLLLDKHVNELAQWTTTTALCGHFLNGWRPRLTKEEVEPEAGVVTS